MVEIEVPDEVGPEIAVNYAGEQVVYRPAGGVVEVEDRHRDEFLAAVAGSRVRVTPAQAAVEPAKSARAKSAQS